MLENLTLRYFVPPIFFLLSLGIGLGSGPHVNKLQQLVQKIGQTEGLTGAAAAVLTGAAIVVALGYIIGVLGATLLRLLGLFPFLPRGMSVYWRVEAKKTLKDLYEFRKDEPSKEEVEIAEQCFIAEFFSPHLYAWLRGRWEYYFTNFNGAVAVLLLFIVAGLTGMQPVIWWWVINFLLLLVFGFNAWQSYWEVTEMDHFMLRNFDRMKDRDHKPLRI